jgi:hypothetical protein
MGAFEFDVVTQHRGELLWLQLAVVGPGRSIVIAMVLVGSIVLGWINAVIWLWLERSAAFRLAGAGGGIGPKFGVTEAL